MLTKVTNAKYIKDFKIEFSFNDGLKKVIDLQEELEGPVFEPLKNKEKFKQFSLNRWTIEWENGADFSPEFLYDLALKQNNMARDEA